MTSVLKAQGLGKRYRRRWALSDCTLVLAYMSRAAATKRRPELEVQR